MKIIPSLLILVSSSAFGAVHAQNTHALALDNTCIAAKKAVAHYYSVNDRQAAEAAGLVYQDVGGRGPDFTIVASKAIPVDCVIQGEDVTVTTQNTVYADLALGGRSGQYPILNNIRKKPQTYTRKIRVHLDDGKWKLDSHDLFPQFTYLNEAITKFSEALLACQADSEKDACLKDVGEGSTLLKKWSRTRTKK